MERKDPEELISQAEEETHRESELAKQSLEWFLDDERVGDMIPRAEAKELLASHLATDESEANRAIGNLVGDLVDPVQQIVSGGEKYVGVVEYNVFEDAGSYGYIDYDDRLGKRKRVVCAKCVEEHDLDEYISHATQGEGTSAEDASWQDLKNSVTSHYADEHEEGPDNIEPGATLISGTTVGGSTVWHSGNDGDGSALDADSVDGQEATELGGSSTSGGSTSGDLRLRNGNLVAPTQTNTITGVTNSVSTSSVGTRTTATNTADSLTGYGFFHPTNGGDFTQTSGHLYIYGDGGLITEDSINVYDNYSATYTITLYTDAGPYNSMTVYAHQAGGGGQTFGGTVSAVARCLVFGSVTLT